MLSFSFRELQLITVLILISGFHMISSTRFVSLKVCAGFSIFDSVFLLKLIIGLFNSKTSELLSKLKYKKTQTHACSLASIFKFRKEVLEFNDICGSCSFPKTDLDSFLSFEYRSFQIVRFSQQLMFDIPLVINLFL